ncbi:MAG TPA: TlpA disulfide reductase family protein [Acidimicrobiia bacterium]|nr:TlpA disulfide reductase family protein [Acidimicrobiia bacterium]
MSTKTASKRQQKTNSSLLWWILGGVAGLSLIVWLAFAIAGEQPLDDTIAFGEVSVEGENLPFFDSSAADPAIGLTAPTVTGQTLDGSELTIGPSDTAKIIVMVAHWCPHCQREVPLIQQWVDSGGLPDGVELYGVTVLTNRLRDGSTWPPKDWLEGEGWTIPTIMDDESGSVVSAYGLTSTPTYVVLGPDNENLGRVAGEIGTAGLTSLAQTAADTLES